MKLSVRGFIGQFNHFSKEKSSLAKQAHEHYRNNNKVINKFK